MPFSHLPLASENVCSLCLPLHQRKSPRTRLTKQILPKADPNPRMNLWLLGFIGIGAPYPEKRTMVKILEGTKLMYQIVAYKFKDVGCMAVIGSTTSEMSCFLISLDAFEETTC